MKTKKIQKNISSEHKKRQDDIENNQGKLYLQVLDLALEAIHACIARDVIKEFRYSRRDELQEHNLILTFSHIALENYAIQQLWKLFDKTNSVFHIWHIIEKMPHPNLKAWFDEKIINFQEDINHLSAWRHNIISHRSAIGHLTFDEFEEKFSNRFEVEEKIKDFLLDFLSQIKFEMQKVPVEKRKIELLGQLKSYKKHVLIEKEKAFELLTN